jgi:hypothetical protein
MKKRLANLSLPAGSEIPTKTANVLPMPIQPTVLRPSVAPTISATGVDRENKVLRNYVVAQLGRFKDWRGEFTLEGLNAIVNIMNSKPKGVKSRFTHPTMSDDGLGKHLGRSRDAFLDKAVDAKTGQEVPAVRASLYFDPTALKVPPGGGTPYGEYIMNLAESDPDAFSSSIAMMPDDLEELPQLDAETGKVLKDEQGREFPPIWIPKDLHASDLVDTGDAVDGVLSIDDPVRNGCAILNRVFDGQPYEVTRERVLSWLDKYLNLTYQQGLNLPGDDVGDLKKEVESLTADKNHLSGVVSELQERLMKRNEENEKLQAENQRLEVERVFDEELRGYIFPGERPKYFPAALRMRERGNGPYSEFRIFIESLKAREKKSVDIEEIAGNTGHSIYPETTIVDPEEEKRSVAEFLVN